MTDTGERHHHECDCVWCWVGMTNTAPPPKRSFLDRLRFKPPTPGAN